MPFDSTALPIASVERETGLSQDLLHLWERRYGFPTPSRNAEGERLYPPEQVRRLARIKRLMDRGHRPETLLTLNDSALSALDLPAPDASRLPDGRSTGSPPLDGWTRLMEARDHQSTQRRFHRELVKLGMLNFIQNTLVPLTRLASEAWANDQIGTAEEELLWENIETYFRNAIADLVPLEDGHPRCLLTTLSGEEHILGLLMLEALLLLEDAYPVPFGPQTSIAGIVHAVETQNIDVVCLSFSIAYPAAQAVQGLTELRRALPAHVQIWAGGQGMRGLLKPVEGVQVIPEFDDLFIWLAGWRSAQGG